MDLQTLLSDLEKAIRRRNDTDRLCARISDEIEAEYGKYYKAQKEDKLRVETLKTQLREQVEQALVSDGEKPDVAGVVVAKNVRVVYEDEAAAIAFAMKHAPELLTLKNTTTLRDWFYKAPVQNVTIDGKPAAVLLVQETTSGGNTITAAVPCPFHESRDVSVRISEDAILSALDEQRYQEEHK